MVKWAEHEFKLNKKDENGISHRENLEQVERQIGYRPPQLENPVEFPSLLSHIWFAFISLNSARSIGPSGVNPLSYQDIKAWKELTNSVINPKEIEAIKRLDNAYLEASYE